MEIYRKDNEFLTQKLDESQSGKIIDHLKASLVEKDKEIKN